MAKEVSNVIERNIVAKRIALPISSMTVTYLRGRIPYTQEVNLKDLFKLINNPDIKEFISIYWEGLEPNRKDETAIKTL